MFNPIVNPNLNLLSQLNNLNYLNNNQNNSQSKILELENKINELESKLSFFEKENFKKDKIIEELNNKLNEKTDTILEVKDKLLEEKDNKIDIMHNENLYLKSICNNATHFVSETMNTVNFIINNLTSAPPIDKNMDYKRIIYDNNTKDKIEVIDEIVHHYRHKTLVKYIGDIIVKCYKKEDPNEQSIWNSDIARKNYLLREIINKNVEWITDKKGIKTKEIIIDPIIKIIENLIRDFLRDDKTVNKDGSINKVLLEKRLNVGIELNEILISIDHKTLHNDVNNYIAQFFYFNKSEYVNNVKTIKKVGRPRIIKSINNKN
jgi:hypothetical protein